MAKFFENNEVVKSVSETMAENAEAFACAYDNQFDGLYKFYYEPILDEAIYSDEAIDLTDYDQFMDEWNEWIEFKRDFLGINTW